MKVAASMTRDDVHEITSVTEMLTRLNATSYDVLKYLLNAGINRKLTGDFTVQQSHIAEQKNCDRKTISRSYQRLKTLGLITYTYEKYPNRSGGISAQNRFWLHLDAITKKCPKLSKEIKKLKETAREMPIPPELCSASFCGITNTENDGTKNVDDKTCCSGTFCSGSKCPTTNSELCSGTFCPVCSGSKCPTTTYSSITLDNTKEAVACASATPPLLLLKKNLFSEEENTPHSEGGERTQIASPPEQGFLNPRIVHEQTSPELSAESDIKYLPLHTQQEDKNRAVHEEKQGRIAMSLPDNTRLSTEWKEIIQNSPVHEDHFEAVFEKFCRHWWEINPNSMKTDWIAEWEKWVQNEKWGTTRPMNSAEKACMETKERSFYEMDSIPGKYSNSEGMKKLYLSRKMEYLDALEVQKKAEKSAFENEHPLHKNIISILGRDQWKSWFEGNVIMESPSGYIMNAGNKWRRDEIQTRFRDILKDLGINLVVQTIY